MKKFIFLSVIVQAILLLTFSCTGDDSLVNDGSGNTSDVAVTSNPSKVGVSYAQIDGYVNLNLITANYSKQEMGVEFSMFEDYKNPGHATTKELIGNKLTVRVDTLTANTKYYYRTYVKLNDLVYYGETRSFSTNDFSNITSTGDALNPTFTSVTLFGKADIPTESSEENFSIGIALSTSRTNLHPDSTYKISFRECSLSSVKDGIYSTSVSQLKSGTTYYYCSYMKMGKKYKLGQVKNFSTRDTDSGIETGEAKDITFTSAKIYGSSSISDLYPLNYSIQYGVAYATSESELTNVDSYWNNVKKVTASLNGNTITAQIQSLQPTTLYYYYAYAIVDGTIIRGRIKSFSTLSSNTTLVTNEASDITINTAILKATTNLANLYSGSSSQINYTFRYSTEKDYLKDDNSYYYSRYRSVAAVLNNTSLSALLNNLQTNTTYYYCIVAYIDGVYLYGEILNFRTHSIDSSILSLNSTDVTINSAKLVAETNLTDNEIRFHFQCSKSEGELTRSSNYVSASVKKQNNNTTVEANVDQLDDNTLYYYRLVITLNDGQTYNSETKFFMTYRKSDYIKTNEASDVTITSAKLNGFSKLEDLYHTTIDYLMYYSNTSSMSGASSKTCEKKGNELYVLLSDLSKNTTYYYYLLARTDNEKFKGEVKSFKTRSESEFFSTGDATNISLTTATINAVSRLNSAYPSANITYKVQYKTNNKTASTLEAILDKETLTATLSDLSMNTAYYYCCTANVDGKDIVGETKSFMTLSPEGRIVTGDVSNITLTSAIIDGTTSLHSIYSENKPIQYFVRYSTHQDLSSPNDVTAKLDGNSLSSSLTGLSINTTYYYCCAAIVNGTEIKGKIRSFKTLSGSGLVTTGNASNITLTSAIIDGTTSLHSNYSENAPIQYFVRYSTHQTLSSPNDIIAKLDGNSLSSSLTGLSKNTTYYYCCAAIVNGTEIKGEIKSFKTLSGSGLVTTGNASNITLNSAVVGGTTTLPTVYPNKTDIQYLVKYAVNNDLSGSLSVNASFEGTNLTATLMGLSFNTTYYYCYYAVVDGQTIDGGIKEFRTEDVTIPIGFIDLGLSCKWASQNVGSNNPSSVGSYFAWGETSSKSNYNTTNYKYSNVNLGENISGTKYDAASSIGEGRIPTKEEFQELIDKCSWYQTSYQGTAGYLIVGNNGNQIFLPSAGRKVTAAVYSGYCMYWTSNKGSANESAYCFKDKQFVETERYIGIPIRSVKD